CGNPDNGCGQPLQCPTCTNGLTCSATFQCETPVASQGLGAQCLESSDCGAEQSFTCAEQDVVSGKLFPGGYCTFPCSVLFPIPCAEGVCNADLENPLGTCLKS